MWRNKEYLKAVALRPCLYCGVHPAGQAHHVRWAGKCGMGMKPDDYYTIPLCPVCHDLVHNDPRKFGEKVGREEIYEAIINSMASWIDRLTWDKALEQEAKLRIALHEEGL